MATLHEHDPYLPLRQVMVEIIAAHTEATHDVTGLAEIRAGVIEAMLTVPRHEFVPTEIRAYAHSDGPLPIGPKPSGDAAWRRLLGGQGGGRGRRGPLEHLVLRGRGVDALPGRAMRTRRAGAGASEAAIACAGGRPACSGWLG
jgi:hypothetical protein